MIQIKTPEFSRSAIVCDVKEAIRARIGRPIEGLQVVFDGDVITVHGRVSTYYLWQLAYSAVRNVSTRLGGLTLDFQVQAVAAGVET